MFDLWKLTVVAMYCAHRFSQYGSTILFYLNVLNSDDKKAKWLKVV